MIRQVEDIDRFGWDYFISHTKNNKTSGRHYPNPKGVFETLKRDSFPFSRYYTDIPDSEPPRNGTSPAKARAAGIVIPSTSPGDGWMQDIGVLQTKLDLSGRPNGFATQVDWLTSVPEGFRLLLRDVSERYGHPVIMVTENGMARAGESFMSLDEAVKDKARQEWYGAYLQSMVTSVRHCSIVLCMHLHVIRVRQKGGIGRWTGNMTLLVISTCLIDRGLFTSLDGMYSFLLYVQASVL